MIRFNIRCSEEHEFEAWFNSNASYEAQVDRGEVACPVCGDTRVRKAPMAPAVSSSRRRAANAQTEQLKAAAAVRDALTKVREHVESNAEHVGTAFAEEARKIHYGETEERAIYGEATEQERSDLSEEGIEVSSIPWIEDAKSN